MAPLARAADGVPDANTPDLPGVASGFRIRALGQKLQVHGLLLLLYVGARVSTEGICATMISIDRTSSTPIFEQLVRQLRFLIATGHYRGSRRLPSTRGLATTLGISFHTVRKAYQQLQEEGVLEAVVGSGYRVRNPSPLTTSERIEQGAGIVEAALHRLAGLGLGPSDIEYLIEEQLSRLSFSADAAKVIFVSPSEEVAALCSKDLTKYLQRPVEPAVPATLPRHQDAEYALAEFRHLASVREALPSSDAIGVATHLSTEALDLLSRMLPTESVGILTAGAETVHYLTDRIKYETRFAGQILATWSADSVEEASTFAGTVDLLIYTPALATKVRRTRHAARAIQISVEVDDGSKREILEALPSQ